MWPRKRPPDLPTLDLIVANIPCFNLRLAKGRPVSAVRTGWVKVPFVVGESCRFLPFGIRHVQTDKNL
jgi:hypothetical protein